MQYIAEDPYSKLANHIILQAVKDYRKACRRLEKNSRNCDANNLKKEIETFFYSGWFGELTRIDPDMLITQLLEEVNL